MPAAARRSRSAALLIAMAVCATLACTAGPATAARATAAKPAPVLKKPAVEGRKLASRFLTLLKGTSTPALKAFLSPAFLLQRADGTFATRTDYLKAVTNVKSFVITDVKATQQGGTLAVRYTATTDQIVDGVEYKRTPAPRLSTFVWNGRAWTLISHANFNTPQ